jgi:hypothetical protein
LRATTGLLNDLSMLFAKLLTVKQAPDEILKPSPLLVRVGMADAFDPAG